ncbi:MAG: thermonuclease family protein [Candidatus Hydrogenedentes bacterium]|nr:thermonuclease family protein [Candidatus Hydrogenedentota bacterium]
MRQCFTYTLLFLALLWAFPIFATETIEGKVVSVADGDTITVLQGKEQIKVRLHGVDAPEKAQDFGTASRNFTSDLCFGKEVTVDVKDTDRYGRKVGIVTVPDGRVLNQELIKAGLAHWYEAYARNDSLLKGLQDEAKSAKRGVWSRPDTVAPWDFRKEKREPSAVAPSKPSPAPRTSKVPAKTDRKVNEVFITETGSKYHRGSCRSLKKSKRAVSKSDALSLGLEPCGICNP